MATNLPVGHVVFVAPDGKLIKTHPAFFKGEGETPCETPNEVWEDGTPTLLRIPLLTLGFMNCSNISREDDTKKHGPTPKWCRRQRQPELRYQTLWIGKPGAKRPVGGRKTAGDRSGLAWHIRRGHFAHYVDDGVSRGLFGKGIFGTFWIEACACGSAENGEIISTYKIKTA